MSKRTVFTTLTSLPSNISRETVMDTLQNHVEMIDLNPLVEERHPVKPPPHATAEEYHCIWYSMTDKVQYLPGGIMSGHVTYTGCFHDLPNGLQTHVYAPMGLDIKGKWTLGGSLPGEPAQPVELGLGAPLHGLYLREDVDMRCNIMMTSFVKKTLKKAHAVLVDRLLVKSKLVEAVAHNERLSDRGPISPALTSPGFSDAGSIRSSDRSTYSNDGQRKSYQNLLSLSGASPSPNSFSPNFGRVDQGYQDANPYSESKRMDPEPVELPSGSAMRNEDNFKPRLLRLSQHKNNAPAEMEG